jgi:CrcB protein
MSNLLLVMLGGAVGSGLRYSVGRASIHAFGAGFPWGTLIVNLVGSLLIGILAALVLKDGVGTDHDLWLLIVVGGLGGFTTFSAFSLDLMTMASRGDFVTAFLYAAGSVVVGLGLAAAGFALARAAA